MSALPSVVPRGAARRAAVVALVVLLAAGAWLRLDGVEWDGGSHAHPDERFLSLVASAVSLPSSVGEYLDVDASPLSPYGTPTGQDYLYGTLPLFAVKAAAVALDEDRYDALHLVGRRMSAIVDLLTLVLVAALAARVGARRRLALLAAAFYATAVVALQHSHFFTVEVWLTAGSTLTLLLAARVAGVPRGRRRMLLLGATGAALGLTVACKLTGVLVAAPVAVGALWGIRRPRSLQRAVTVLADAVADALVLVPAAYLAFRLADPYAFASTNWLDVRLAPSLQAALEAQATAVAGESMNPPNLQWLRSAPVVDPLANLLLWAVPVVGVLGVAGVAVVGWDAVRSRRAGRAPTPEAVLLAVLVVVVLAWFTPRFVHPLRYLLPAVPALCVLAALAVARLHRVAPRAGVAVAVVALAVGGAWAAAYTAVHRRPHTRVQAAAWVAEHVPAGSRIAFEHWDDGLPLDPSPYEVVEVPVFAPDDRTKARRLFGTAMSADYYVIASPRAWWTVGRLPDRFPLMTAFYRRLLAGDLGFERVAAFRSDPGLFGLTIRDTAAEEAQWVYDHPPVVILRRTERLSRRAFAERLGA